MGLHHCGGDAAWRVKLDALARRTGRTNDAHAASVGIDLPVQIKKDLIRVEYEPPQKIEVDVHCHHVEELAREFKPKRVVIDSLSTYGSNFGTEGRAFRDFFHGLVA